MLASLVKSHVLKSWEPKYFGSGHKERKKETYVCWVVCLGCTSRFLNQADNSYQILFVI